ncbi:hypothetical protein LEP1GSC034_0360 [Leptospira interrogans str. 2003000735]|uniref:Uncharacterized protein n=15 Tax=Leptospira TaxID=171 RepID=A0A0E2CY73_LEPIR|nr:hypothetical protein G436_2871 [Leptospira interrogans serovar Hardjo str. Norma]EJO77625.1 hypothetical protein LEP1GSC045_1410 [Leptospira interrogans serovar Pomona str. Kennewicki LC82-25]EJP04973.1 hypothetical protein LEP1GSC007_2749 [Leptospira interrogans serovar Bulgarica str. Mallika]EJP16462.1 hypothetical protein LEP1GSC080_0489 [Leptospira interrogans str. FPW2026]EKN86594.1 hypothetical protein LEP1GSC027_2862 [Leptospira interrogans str. 2002000624]EKN96385.1 hypothetical pro
MKILQNFLRRTGFNNFNAWVPGNLKTKNSENKLSWIRF